MEPIDLSTLNADPRKGGSNEERAIEFRLLAVPVPPGLEAMTFPIYRRLLDLQPTSRHPEQGDTKLIEPWGVLAWQGERPIGLLLAEKPADPNDKDATEILSIFVAQDQRRQGIAEGLVEFFEKQARELGFRDVSAVYTTGKASIETLERMFARRGWSKPEPRTASVRFTPEAAFASDLLDPRRLRAQARGLEIFPWSEVSTEDMAELKNSHEQEPWIAPLLAPWRFVESGFHSSSVGARYRGQIVGWVITHEAGPDVLRFTCSFMRHDLSRRGRIVPLYNSVLEQIRDTHRLCTFITPYSYGPMVEFIRRRLAPISTYAGGTRESRLTLSSR